MEQIPIGRNNSFLRVHDTLSLLEKRKARERTQDYVNGIVRHNRLHVSAKYFSEETPFIDEPKSILDLQIISTANQVTNKILAELGIPTFDVPESNIYFLPREQFFHVFEMAEGLVERDSKEDLRKRNAQAFFVGEDFAIYYLADDSNFNNSVFKASVLAHEMLHAKARKLYLMNIDRGHEVKVGLDMFVSAEKHNLPTQNSQDGLILFRGMHEAIVSALEELVTVEIIDQIPELAEEYDRQQQRIDELPFYNTVLHFSRWEMFCVIRNEQGEEIPTVHSYPVHRRVLNLICSVIYHNFSSDFNSEEDVLKMFARAHFSGNMLEIARYIENTFGKGAFKIISQMDLTKKSALETEKKLIAGI
jgi:hypothetical protein